MKVLKNAKFTGNIKINDTNTDIYFQAYDDGALQKLNAGQCSFRIKNDTGYLITISNVSTETDYITFKSNELKSLPVGTYYLELWVEDSTGTYIYPDESFCKLRINENVTVAQGTTIPTISLDEYESKLQGYVDTAVADGTQKIESDFDKYVDSITDSTIATATKASQDAATAINTANSANAAAQNATNIANAAKSNADTASQNASTALDTANAVKSTVDNASQTASNAQTIANEAKLTADAANSSATNALNKATENSGLISTLTAAFNNWNSTQSLPACDFGKLPLGIYMINGWAGVSQYTNAPSFIANKWSSVIAFQNGYVQYQFVLEEGGTIHYRITRVSDGTVKIDWKTITFS